MRYEICNKSHCELSGKQPTLRLTSAETVSPGASQVLIKRGESSEDYKGGQSRYAGIE